MLPRSVIEEVGLFDEDFFIFFEETDLCFRIWLAGYTVLYEPKSVIYHAVGGDTTTSGKYKYERRIYLIFKNTTCSYLKNFGTRNLIKVFPFFVSVQTGIFFYFLITLRFYLILAIIKAYWWNLSNLKSTLHKRRKVQKEIRKATDKDLDMHIKRNPRLSYYYYSLFKTTMEYKD